MRLAIIASIFIVTAHAQARLGYDIPKDRDVLTQISANTLNVALPTQLELLVWNVHKGDDRKPWQRDFLKLSSTADLIFIQEAMIDNFMDRLLQGLSDFNFYMAQSFVESIEHWSTGVTTGARAVPTHLQFLRSPDREPLIHTPKMILLSYYNLASGEELMTINIHAINFVRWKKFARQILALETAIKSFNGKIIFSGDFNTWNRKRKDFLYSTLQGWGFSRYRFKDDPRWLKLDHLFLKGCQVIDGKILSEISSSDHSPLQVQLDCH